MTSPLRLIPILFAGTALFLNAGCVAKSTYLAEQKKAESLSTEVDQLKQKNAELDGQLQKTQMTEEALAQQNANQAELVTALHDVIVSQQVKVTTLADKVSISMVDKVLFNSGSAKISPAGENVLRQIGEAIKKIKGKRVLVGGHTDNVPISPALKSTYATNWELSSARATAVVRFLQEKVGVPGPHLVAAGFGATQPVADNKTAAGREANRRIEILLIPSKETLSSVKSLAE